MPHQSAYPQQVFKEIMQLEIAFIGLGNVARAFARLLVSHRKRLAAEFGISFRTIGVATRTHGSVISPSGLDLEDCVAAVEQGSHLTQIPGCLDAGDAVGMLEICSPDILFETTPLNPSNGEPATEYIRLALRQGINVVSANKGPVAFAYKDLKEIASERGVQYRFEGAVMDGTPVFNLVELCLPGARVLGFAGVLNSTTNLILSGMESGRSFEDSLTDAKRAGIAEENSDYDIDGWDAAVKAAALARVLMDADTKPGQVHRTGIRTITKDDLIGAAAAGNVIRLIARGRGRQGSVELNVAPEAVPLSSTLGSVRGTSNVLILETDLMGEIAIVETDPTVEQTGYALLSDMIRICRQLDRAR